MSKNIAPLSPDKVYHIFNRTNNKEQLFTKDYNYLHFLNQLKKYVLPYCDVFCYALLGNHFHIMIRVKSEERLLEGMKNSKQKTFSDFLSKQFSHFFGAYSKAFNKQEERKGSLMQRPFKRCEVKNTDKFRSLLAYIHLNAQKHKIVGDFRNYKWTSYHSYLSEKPTLLLRDEVLEWFGSKQEFIDFHLSSPIFEADDLWLE